MKITPVHESILLVGLSDYIHMGDFPFRVLGRGYKSDKPLPEGVREQSIHVIRDLLEAGLIEAGMPAYRDIDFAKWNFLVEEIVNRIETEWDQLGHEPLVGDIVWFRLTPLGEKVAREIELREQGPDTEE